MNEELYNEWLVNNAEFLERFLKENVCVQVDRDCDFYGSEWYETTITVNVPYDIIMQTQANRVTEEILSKNNEV